ncbi:hypothetical protein Nizo1840_1922 [Lactiplantibacillus plantarum]|nr:hypothetical protein Nizo1840_1922 [Lactiplantibacillus plantarum]
MAFSVIEYRLSDYPSVFLTAALGHARYYILEVSSNNLLLRSTSYFQIKHRVYQNNE